ncbi:hypothetical protein B0H16DRAFT_1366829 [Mycena metata]|uniref:Uncharacterized protein n=1 Tax=Mycena metata TaxID=1033252 RepID=A0AAD7JKD2_9AGAR|nr:hypothetical protein B0H16DRAFT_1366829 [Mycena metata]
MAQYNPPYSYNPYAEVAPDSPPLKNTLSPNRAVIENLYFRADTSELKTLPTVPSGVTQDGQRLRYYPTSLLLLVVWIVFVVILLWLLESAVSHGPKSLTQPWGYTQLPSLLITVFAQGHGAITAMHLARVSVSALHSARTSPSTWAEVFWISDRAWQGPVGMLFTVLAASRLRVRISAHFLLCAITCLTALVTPIILSRAYPIRTISIDENTTISPSALDVVQMGAVDAYAEIGTGAGGWTTGLSVMETYNSSVYLPSGVSRDGDPLDFFFGADVEGKTVRLPGLHLTGQCVTVDSNVSSIADFPAYCTAQIPNPGYMTPVVEIVPVTVDFLMQGCCNTAWSQIFGANASFDSNVGYIYIQSNTTSSTGTLVANVNGIIRCDTQIATGLATLSGVDGTFSAFSEETLYKPTQGGDAIQEPLLAMLEYWGLTFNGKGFEEDLGKGTAARTLGFVGETDTDGDGFQTYLQPSMQELATTFWRGISHTVGIGLLSRSNGTVYPAVQRGQTAVYVREAKFADAAYALLAVWLLLLVAITARSFRPTFADSFDGYLTAKLVQEKPGLMDNWSGDLAANGDLRQRFGGVERDAQGRIVVV